MKETDTEELQCEIPGCENLVKDKQKRLCEGHKFDASTERPRRFQCDVEGCAAAYLWSSHLRRHKIITHERRKGEFKCKILGCLASFGTQLGLTQHIKRAHYRETRIPDPLETFLCEHCDKRFAKEYRLREHSAVHTKLKPFKCEKCGEEFDLHSVYKKHTRAHGKEAEASKEVLCSTCNNRFDTAKGLSIHIKFMHPKFHSCDLCGLHFANAVNLRAHTDTHSKIRNVFRCAFENCKKIYYYERGLNEHIRRIHNRLVHTCQYCEKTLSSKQKLRNHLKLHDLIPKALPPRPERKSQIRKYLARRLKKPADPESLYKMKPNLGRPKGIKKEEAEMDLDSSNSDELSEQSSCSSTASEIFPDLNLSETEEQDSEEVEIKLEDLGLHYTIQTESTPTLVKPEDF